ncbi:helix-turn-helix transcriptional regulator [Caballeronia telluris]|uniref:Phage transcriptional regulator, AlpA n=1 Tax=Caballeronia telluris TaxID=326475 RepID=A0A158J7B1_9BURK|nr:AlpA family phage regulatory protein [Caballeronia telluris]SAL64832.1 phage transcriptional regulator, AlpA [Caballeronia telluris]
MPNIKQLTQHQLKSPPSSIPVKHSSTARQPDKAPRIFRMKDLVECTGLSRATIYTLMSTDPTFARKIRLTARTIGFYAHEVEAWLASRAQMRDAA